MSYTDKTSTSGQESDDAQEKAAGFNCDYCSFIFTKKITLNKHMNTKHGDICCQETVSTFIFRLGLEKAAQEYKYYFRRYGYTRAEAHHVEKMVDNYGVEYILKPVD